MAIDRDGIAIEINHTVVPKSQYKNIIIKNDDKIEIVQFIGRVEWKMSLIKKLK